MGALAIPPPTPSHSHFTIPAASHNPVLFTRVPLPHVPFFLHTHVALARSHLPARSQVFVILTLTPQLLPRQRAQLVSNVRGGGGGKGGVSLCG